MDLIVVPFFLAAHVPAYIDPPPMYLKSTFNVHVNSELTIVNGSIINLFFINFTSELICNATSDDRLSCYIRNPKLTVRSTIMSTVNVIARMLRETTDVIPFNYINSIPIELRFVPVFGIEDHNISDDVNPSTDFIDLFLTIASQMNIGFNINLVDGWDSTYIGTCMTNYTIDHRFEDPHLIMPKYMFYLKSISNFEIEDTKVKLIEKQRSIDSCYSLNDYMFGIKHIKTSLPVHHRIKESTTRLKISIQDFVSTTENEYKLYDQDEMEIGNATENVYLHLAWIEPL